MYDLADTLFSSLFVTIFFPLLVVLKGGTPFQVGLTMSASLLLAGLLVPTLGALADITGRKKLLLFVFTVLCCVFTFFTGFFGLGLVLLFGALANLCYHASLDVYDSLLVDISTLRTIGWISGLGTALGYGGTLVSVLIAYVVGLFYGMESEQGITVMFILTALFYVLFSLFTFFLVRKDSQTKITVSHLKEAFQRVISTIKNIKEYRSVWLFLLASFLYVDGASTAIIFLYLYARDQLGMSVVQFLPIYVVMAISAGIGSLIFGKLTDRYGHKRILMMVLGGWIIIITGLYLRTTYPVFLTVGIVGGALLGAIWTITRPLLVQLAPKEKIAELFGYQGLTEKFSGVIGPVVFGYLATAVGFREALLVVIVLFILGGAVLSAVRTDR